MGQRLVIVIQDGDKNIAALYYHWSAYTRSALVQTKDVIDCIWSDDPCDMTTKEIQMKLIRFAEGQGGGLSGNEDKFGITELENVSNIMYPEAFKTNGINRNDGLIAITKHGIDNILSWSEGDVYIDIGTGEVSFGVLSSYDSVTDYYEERESWDDEFNRNHANIPKIDCNIIDFYFDDIEYIIDALKDVNDNVIEFNDCVAEFIE